MYHPSLAPDIETSLPEWKLLQRHAKDANLRKFRRGTTLYEPGLSEFVGFVMAGTIKLTTVLPDGRTNIVGVIEAPGFFGRFFGVATEFTIEAATDVVTLCFERRAFDELLSSNPALEHLIHMANLHQLDEAHERIIVLACQSIMERLATYLVLRLIARETAGGRDRQQAHIQVPFNRRDFAAYLGTTVETVSRCVQALVKRGTISVIDSSSFRILRRGDLVDIARQSEDDLREMVRRRAPKWRLDASMLDDDLPMAGARMPRAKSAMHIAAE